MAVCMVRMAITTPLPAGRRPGRAISKRCCGALCCALVTIGVLTVMSISATTGFVLPAGAERSENRHPFGIVRCQLRLRGGNSDADRDLREILTMMHTHEGKAALQAEACRTLAIRASSADNQAKIVLAGGLERIMAAMDRHAGDTDVQDSACRALGQLAFGNTQYQIKMAAAGGLKRIITAMKRHTEKPSVQHNACGALLMFATHNERNTREIVAAGGLECIMAAMDMEHAIVQHLAYTVFAALLPFATKYMQAGIVHIVAAMARHSGDATLQCLACDVLGQLATVDSDNQVRIAEARGLDSILTAMDTHKKEHRVQWNACIALQNLAVNNKENQVKIAAAGGPQRIITAMVTHKNEPLVQSSAFGALQCLAVTSKDSQQDTVAADVVKLIVAAMETNMGDARVQLDACRALGELSFDNTDNQIKIMLAGGLECIVAAMDRHVGDARLQATAFKTLSYLAIVTGNHAKIAAAGSLGPRWIAAMGMHKKEPNVQRYACIALQNLATNNNHNQQAIMVAGGLKIIVAAMKTHQGDVSVQRRSCSILATLAFNNTNNQVQIVAAGGLECIISAMDIHKGDAVVQHSACRIFGQLAFKNTEYQIKIAAAGGLKRIITAMEKHKMRPDVQLNACGALACLAADNLDNQRGIVAIDAVQLIVTAMEMHKWQAGVQQAASSALTTLLSDNTDNQLERIMAAMDTLTGDSEVQKIVRIALQELAKNKEGKNRSASDTVEVEGCGCSGAVGSLVVEKILGFWRRCCSDWKPDWKQDLSNLRVNDTEHDADNQEKMAAAANLKRKVQEGKRLERELQEQQQKAQDARHEEDQAVFSKVWADVVDMLSSNVSQCVMGRGSPHRQPWMETIQQTQFDFTKAFEEGEDDETYAKVRHAQQDALDATLSSPPAPNLADSRLAHSEGAGGASGLDADDINTGDWQHVPTLQPVVALVDGRQGAHDHDVMDLAQLESIKLTCDALKWYGQADSRQKALFCRRLQQLALGERSRILSKRLVGSKNYAVLSTTYAHMSCCLSRTLSNVIPLAKSSVLRNLS